MAVGAQRYEIAGDQKQLGVLAWADKVMHQRGWVMALLVAVETVADNLLAYRVKPPHKF
jgi:hypothetical protein